jgi:hypothetical protein
MSENNITYESVLKLWCAKCGIQYEDLLTPEADLFKQFANSRLRYAWDYAEWPETVDHFDEPLVDNEAEVTDSMSYVMSVWDSDPYINNDARELQFQRRRNQLVVRGWDLPAQVHVVYKMRLPDFAVAADEIPYRFGEYVAQGAYADYLRTEADERGEREEMRAEMMLQRELDIFERMEKQGRWGNGNVVYATPGY